MKPSAFFDFSGTLFHFTTQGWKVHHAGVALLIERHKTHRIGLLCNIPPGHDEESIGLLLRVHGLDIWIDPALILFASRLPCPLPDPGAFRVAAALAQNAPADLLFVSADVAAGNIAAEAGWSVEEPTQTGAPSGALLADDDTGAPVPALLAEVDPDKGPTFILRGRVVTLNAGSEIIEDGRILVSKGRIVDILRPGAALPAEFAMAPLVATQSTLYPGLIDLHNHLAYNVLTLWQVPSKFSNRSKWQRHKDYGPNISMPARVIAGHDPTAKAAARYIEAKAIVGGCTTSQGMVMSEKKIIKYFKGLMRNVERTADSRLVEVGTSVLDLNAADVAKVTAFRNALKTKKCYLYHLSEGTDPDARARFQDLMDNDLLAESLVGIHSLALSKNDLVALKDAGAKVVWSPFSNLLLYGETLKLTNVIESGITVALGCDWAPSGSKNPLLELKVAKWCIDQSSAEVRAAITNEKLVRMVTSTPARILHWEEFLGSLKAGAMADIVAIEGETGDPYLKLINARERNVTMVTIHGTPRYGRDEFMSTLQPDASLLEKATVDGVSRSFQFKHPESLINSIKLADAISTLELAMADLPKFVKDSGQVKAGLQAAGLDPAGEFGLVLDMDAHDGADESGLEAAALLAQVDPSKIAKSVDLDPLAVNDAAYFGLLAAQKNLPDGLVTVIQNAYA